MIILILFTIILCIIIVRVYLVKKSINNIINEENIKRDSIEEFFILMGASYDEKQDIIYSSLDSWQREYGYCKLYDNLMWILHMAVDCEPIYFKYNNKVWLIEFWKGQYAIATGCEIGIYVSDELGLPMKNIFFYSVDDKDMLDMEFVLKRDGEVLFQRREEHWWLTGFKFGEYSNPNKLSMDIKLTFKDKEMLIAFFNALNKVGYKYIDINDNNISFSYSKPKTKQCFARISIINFFIQRNNKRICRKYSEIVKDLDNVKDKVEILRKNNIEIYIRILKIILSRKLFYKISKF